MDKTAEQLQIEHNRQYGALDSLHDEVMSMLHAHQLRQPSIESTTVVEWLRFIYDEVQVGMGRPTVFKQVMGDLADPGTNT